MFGPPQRFTIASTCSWLGHSVSGLRHDTLHPFQIRFRFGSVSLTLNLASHRNSPARSTKSTTSRLNALCLLVSLTVSGSISLPSRGSFHLSLTVLFAIGHMVVFSLLGWSPFLPSGFLVSRRTPDSARSFKVSSTGVSPSLQYLSRYFDYPFRYYLAVLTPNILLWLVWASPISLATTFGITFVFFSSGYLDVSVPRVPFLTLWIGVRITGVYPVRFPHSDIHGSQVICTSPWLFAAYHVFRRLLVPRHPPCALLCLTSRCIALQHFVLLKKAFLSFY